MDKYSKSLEQYFNNWGELLPLDGFMEKVNEALTGENFVKTNSRLVFSVCPDDVNRLVNRKTIENALKDVYNSEFHLGGLGAYPIGGVSGITAASHHPPDDVNGDGRKDGNLVFFLSPHMGIIENGDFQYGKIIRPGQEKITSSCGAMMGFLAALKEAGTLNNFKVAADNLRTDPTRLVLQNELINNYSEELDKILEYEDEKQQVAELFKLNYDAITNKATQMIEEFMEKENDHFKGNIAVISGLTVNLPESDSFILKDLTYPKN